MNSVYNLLLYIHVVIGFGSLVLFWLPVMARKGSPWHKQAGRWYANAMYVVSLSALIIAIMVLMDPMGVKFPDNQFTMENAFQVATSQREQSLFLLAISVLVFASVRHGLLSLKAKFNHQLMRAKSHLLLNITLLVVGLSLGVLAFVDGSILFWIFAALCTFASIGNLRYCMTVSPGKGEWLITHLSSMFGAGIGSYTAFFVFGGNRYLGGFLEGYWRLVPWVAPFIIGTILTAIMTRKYRAQFAT